MQTTTLLGADLLSARTDSRGLEAGNTVRGEDGREYMLVTANGAVTVGNAVVLDSAFAATPLDTTVSATAFGQKCGVAAATANDTEFFWVIVNGKATMTVGTSAAANVALNTTATAGVLDDDATIGSEVITGVVLLTAEAGGTATAMLTYPTVGATL